MTSLVALDRRTPVMRWRDARDESSLWGDLRPELAGAVSQILHATMEDELAALLVARPYERTLDRSGYRNGRFRRWLATEIGAIELSVPRAREIAYRPSFLERAARRTSTVDELLRTAFLRGLSTRETAALAERLTGVSLSAGAVSRLTAVLDGRVGAFHRRPRSAYLCATCSSMACGSACAITAAEPLEGSFSPPMASPPMAAGSCSTIARRVPSPRWLGGAVALAGRARPRSRRRRSRGRRRRRWHRCRGRRGVPRRIAPALLDPPGPQSSRCHPAR